MSKITNITDLRSELIAAFEQLKQDPRRVVQAKELANIAGKIINSARVEIEYAAVRKETPQIEFLKPQATQPHEAKA